MSNLAVLAVAFPLFRVFAFAETGEETLLRSITARLTVPGLFVPAAFRTEVWVRNSFLCDPPFVIV